MRIPHAAWRIALVLVLATGCVRSIEARGQSWWRARTSHVVVDGDGGEEPTRRAAEHLAQIEHAISLAFYHCGPRPDHTIEVTMLSHEAEFDALVSDHTWARTLHPVDDFLVLPSRIVMNSEAINDWRSAAVFAHEITHVFVNECFPDAPSWLHEGLATVFETAYIEDGHVVVGAPAYGFSEASDFDIVERGNYVQIVPSRLYTAPSALTSLSSRDFYRQTEENGERRGASVTGRYASAWLLTHMLALGPDRALRQRFVSYLSSLSAGAERSESAFDVAFYGVDLNAAAERYAHERRVARITRPWDGIAVEVSTESVSPLDAQLRLAEIGWRHSRAGTVAVAEEHAAFLETLPEARIRLLLLRVALTRDLAAREALRPLLEAAEAVRPLSVDELRMQLMLARDDPPSARMDERAERLTAHPDRRPSDLALVATLQASTPSPSPERIALARSLIDQALALDPRSPAVWLANGRVALASGDREGARRAFRRAENLAGHDDPIGIAVRLWLGRAAAP